mmetsp:Transcript_26737/g.61591  ORF Transcript_26737/g.61591 Transcript_26737/m.61591 type:complete len:247 (+) Transcript_26737:118-858(+)
MQLARSARGFFACYAVLLACPQWVRAQDYNVSDAAEQLKTMQAAVDSLVVSVKQVDDQLTDAEQASVHVTNVTKNAVLSSYKLAEEVQNRSKWIESVGQAVPKLNVSLNSNDEVLNGMAAQDQRISTLLSRIEANFGDAITPAEEQYLEELINELWKVADPDEESSVERMQERIDKASVALTDLEGVLKHRIRKVLVRRLRGKTDGLRRALSNMNDEFGNGLDMHPVREHRAMNDPNQLGGLLGLA